MSNYKNMIVDFPSRIGEILVAFDSAAKDMQKEVTFLLTIADTAITIPLERIHKSHPSHEFNSFPQISTFEKSLYKDSFICSPLWPDSNPNSWCYGGPLASVEGQPDSWPEINNPIPMDTSVTSMKILRHIRNALSHGNVYTRGKHEITQLVFLSWISYTDKRYMYIICTPNDFRKFIDNWISSLKPIKLPPNIIPE